MEKIISFILDYLQAEYTIPDTVDIQNFNYIEEGYVDSLGLISFVTALEDQFNVSFNNDEIAEPGFRVVGSLAVLVNNKMENQ